MNSSEQFEAIVSRHYEALFRYAMSLTRSQADAEDLTQQTFYTWAEKGHQLRDAAKVKTWLFTTLHRAFLSTRRRSSRFPHYELEAVAEELPPSRCPDAANQIDTSQVLTALGQIDEVFQSTVALFYVDDLSHDEIAAVLEIPVGTVKSRLSRGIMQLRKILLPDRAFPVRETMEWDSRPTGSAGTACRVGNHTSVDAAFGSDANSQNKNQHDEKITTATRWPILRSSG